MLEPIIRLHGGVIDKYLGDGLITHSTGLPIIAEDLGLVTPDVIELLNAFELPGMKVLQFGFSGPDNPFLPHNYVPNCVAYTGTHDNDTTVGWFNSQAGEGSTRSQREINAEKDFALRYLQCGPNQIHQSMMRAIWSSVACISIAPVQDLLGLPSQARMNTPGLATGNWTWRCEPAQLTPKVADSMRQMTEAFGRAKT